MNRILFNGLIYEKNGAGISRYAYKLMETFLELSYPIDFLIRGDCVDDLKGENVYVVEKEITSSSKRIIEEQIKQLYRYKKYDMVHFPDYATPVFYNGLKVATIHDMAMHTMADKYTMMQNVTKKTLLSATIKGADCLICDSEFAKKELLTYYPQVEHKVEVIPLGIDIPKKSEQVMHQEMARRLGIHKPFILYVGTIAPHKNIVKLIEAFDILKKQGQDVQLVIAGKKGWMYEEVFKIVKERALEQSVIFTDYISDEDLEVLYNRALAFASVSLYEGFGFPPLEAMGRGCPTIVSDIEIFKETCQDAALYCNPNDEKDIARQLAYIIEHEELRNKLREKGLKQVQQFQWKYTAEKVYNIYRGLLEKKKEK